MPQHKKMVRLLAILIATTALGCSQETHLVLSTVQPAPVALHDSLVEADPAIEAIIEPYRANLESQMNEVLAVSDTVLERAKPEGLLGNFVADLSLQAARDLYHPEDTHPADFCLLNHGGLRTTLPQGDITRGKLFELMPFENELLVVTLTGAKTAELLRYLAAADGHPVAGITMGIKDGLPENVLINTAPLDTNRTYKVVTTDYLANGGDKMTFFANPVAREELGIKLRDAIINHVEELGAANKPLTASIEGRIYHVQ